MLLIGWGIAAPVLVMVTTSLRCVEKRVTQWVKSRSNRAIVILHSCNMQRKAAEKDLVQDECREVEIGTRQTWELFCNFVWTRWSLVLSIQGSTTCQNILWQFYATMTPMSRMIEEIYHTISISDTKRRVRNLLIALHSAQEMHIFTLDGKYGLSHVSRADTVERVKATTPRTFREVKYSQLPKHVIL